MKLSNLLVGSLFVAIVSVELAACSGSTSSSGGGNVGTLKASVSGAAIDRAISGAQIIFTAGAPLNDSGATTIGTFTANASGVFASTVTLPSSAVPVFGNAVDPNNSSVVLSSYLGQSTALQAAAASGVLTSSNLPDLDITPVSTAALAVYYQVNNSTYANLTPATYSSNLQQYNSDILAIAAAMKAVGDNLCTPASSISSTTNLAAAIAGQSNLTSGNSTTLATAATILGGNCASVLASLPQEISANPDFSPELYLGDVIDSGASSVLAATSGVTFALEGIIAESGRNTASSSVSANPASVFGDSAVSVDAKGNITSTDNKVSGSLTGNFITLTVTNGSQHYSIRGKIGVVQSALISGGAAYSIQGGGTNTASNVLTNFAAVLSTSGVAPIWNGITPPATATANCAAGAFPVRLESYGSEIGGGNLSECVVPSATGWTVSAGTNPSYHGNNIVSATPSSLSAPSWIEVSADSPFILAATASYTNNGTTTTGSTYYVLGTTTIVFASSAANNLFSIHGNSLTRLSESDVDAISGVGIGGIGGNNRYH
jgi:hypothetical protein